MMSAFWVAVQVRSPRAPYPAPTSGQVWVRSPEPGARAFFRLRLPVFNSLPQTVTLWTEAFQESTAYVNGVDVLPLPQAPDKLIDTAPDVPKFVQTADIRPTLAVGLNVVGLEVVSLDGQAPAFRARVEVRYGNGVDQTYGVSPSSWQSTTNVALTGQELPESGAFSRPNLEDGSWVAARTAPKEPGTSTVSQPPDAFTLPADQPAIAGAYGSRTLVASTKVEFPSGCDEGWMRVAASGAFSVSLDGKAVATAPASTPSGKGPSSIPLSIFDLCPVAHPGWHTLTVAVAASTQPVVYVDGLVRVGSDTTSFATGPGWHAGSSGSHGATVAVVVNPEASLGAVFARSMGTTVVPASQELESHLLLLAELLAVVAIVLALLGAFGLSLTEGSGVVFCGMLPALGVLLILIETRHLVYVPPPFPDTPPMLALVLALGVVGTIAVAIAAVRRPKRMASSVTDLRRAGPVARGWVRVHWSQCTIAVFVGVWCLLQSYDLMFNPLWQDELSSLAAAQGMRAHILPEWPSGFLYWKSELYSALIAVVGGIAHDNPSVLKEVTVLWFGATILLFGLVLMPLVLKERRWWHVAGTVVFATAPFEMGHSQDIRMYQMVQCLVVIVAILLLKAIHEPTTRRVALLMVAVVAMYLTHEESFGVLLCLPIALVMFDGLRWVRNWRWWAFGSAALFVIVIQLMLALTTHPPIFGIDPSGGPLVSWSPQPFFYVANYFFAQTSSGASITVVSWLAVIGIAVGIARKDAIRIYVGSFWIIPMAVVSVALSTKDTRYVFLCLPFVFTLAVCGTVDIVDGIRTAVLRWAPRGSATVRRVFAGTFGLCVVVAIMVSLIGGLNDYGTWTGRAFSANISHRWLDYPTAVSYVKAREQPGDAVISVATPNLVAYTLGRPPNYWIPPHRTETLLYVFEKNGQAVDTQYGIPTILTQGELDHAISAHPRVWLIGSDSAIRSLVAGMRQTVETRFRLVEEGESVSVYLSTSS
jgi:hypothetical protein